MTEPTDIFDPSIDQWKNPPDGFRRSWDVKWQIFWRDESRSATMVENHPHMKLEGGAIIFAQSRFMNLTGRLIFPLDLIHHVEEIRTRILTFESLTDAKNKERGFMPLPPNNPHE